MSEIETLIADAEAFVAQIKTSFADGKLSLKEILGLASTASKLALEAYKLL